MGMKKIGVSGLLSQGSTRNQWFSEHWLPPLPTDCDWTYFYPLGQCSPTQPFAFSQVTTVKSGALEPGCNWFYNLRHICLFAKYGHKTCPRTSQERLWTHSEHVCYILPFLALFHNQEKVETYYFSRKWWLRQYHRNLVHCSWALVSECPAETESLRVITTGRLVSLFFLCHLQKFIHVLYVCIRTTGQNLCKVQVS